MLRIALAMAFLPAGCAENPVTHRRELALVSEEQAIAASVAAYREIIARHDRKGEIERGTPRAARVQEIAGRIIAQAQRVRPETAQWR